MPERGAMPWAAAVVFWIFVSVIYAAQIWWLSQLPGETINVRAAITWQTTYFLLWIPLTLAVWRLTSGWTPESAGGWRRMLLRHLPIFVAAAFVHFMAGTPPHNSAGARRGGFLAPGKKQGPRPPHI